MRYLLDTCVLSELVRPKPNAKVVSWVDALIGATAKVHGCAVVTRNVVDLEKTAIEVINLW